jgi:hypothetical protein
MQENSGGKAKRFMDLSGEMMGSYADEEKYTKDYIAIL